MIEKNQIQNYCYISANNTTQNQSDNAITTSVKNGSEVSHNYKQTVDKEVLYQLSILGLKPSTGSITIFDKTYTENNFKCTKKQDIFGHKTIIKEENTNLSKTFSNILTGKQPEKIIEEYDKNENLTKKTHYKNDGSYEIIKYNDKGDISEKAEVINKKNNNSSYQTELKQTYYNKDGTYYIQTFTIEMNDNCTDNEPIIKKDLTYYKKNGEIDFLTTLLSTALIGTIENTIEKNA